MQDKDIDLKIPYFPEPDTNLDEDELNSLLEDLNLEPSNFIGEVSNEMSHI